MNISYFQSLMLCNAKSMEKEWTDLPYKSYYVSSYHLNLIVDKDTIIMNAIIILISININQINQWSYPWHDGKNQYVHEFQCINSVP